MNPNTYKFKAKLWRLPYTYSSYVIFPGDIKKIFGKGLVHVHATIDGIPLDCSIINRGYDHNKTRPTYIISVRKELLDQMGKIYGDMVTVTVREREKEIVKG